MIAIDFYRYRFHSIDYFGQFDGYCCIFFAALLLTEVPLVAGREYNVLILPSFWRHNVQLKTQFNLRTVKCLASRHSVLKEFTKVEGKEDPGIELNKF